MTLQRCMVPLVFLGFVVPFAYTYLHGTYRDLYELLASTTAADVPLRQALWLSNDFRRITAFLAFFENNTWFLFLYNIAFLFGLVSPKHGGTAWLSNTVLKALAQAVPFCLSQAAALGVFFWALCVTPPRLDRLRAEGRLPGDTKTGRLDTRTIILSYLNVPVAALSALLFILASLSGTDAMLFVALLSNGILLFWWLLPGVLYKPYRAFTDLCEYALSLKRNTNAK